VNKYYFECPECFYEQYSTNDYLVGEVINCPDCGIEVEITGFKELTTDLSKLLLDTIIIKDEDWGE